MQKGCLENAEKLVPCTLVLTHCVCLAGISYNWRATRTCLMCPISISFIWLAGPPTMTWCTQPAPATAGIPRA